MEPSEKGPIRSEVTDEGLVGGRSVATYVGTKREGLFEVKPSARIDIMILCKASAR